MEDIKAGEKYVVFKREDYERMNGIIHERMNDYIIQDAVVIRLQDFFAESALAEYANQIQTTIEILQHLGHPVPPKLVFTREFFFEAASAAGEIADRKLPD